MWHLLIISIYPMFWVFHELYTKSTKIKSQETPQMNCRSTSTAPWISSCTASSGSRCCNMLYNKHAKSAWRPSSREMSSLEKVRPGIKPRFFSQKMAPGMRFSTVGWLKSHSQPPGMVLKPYEIMVKNYQPQLVQDFSHQQYDSMIAEMMLEGG